MRKTGIDIIGEAPWGTHFCHFYDSQEDLLEILVPYFVAGLENNEVCMWVTSDPLGVEAAKAAMRTAMPDLDHYLARGQLEILPHTDWYLAGGSFNQERVLKGWEARHESAINNGFDGLRLSGNTFWLEERDWEGFAEYEATINRVIGSYRMLAICSYALERCGASEIIDVVRNHRFALVKREGRWCCIESSEQKRLESKILRAKQEWERTFDSVPDLIAIIDSHHRLLRVNRPMAERLGLTPEQCIGLTCHETVHGLAQPPSCCPHSLTMADGRSHLVEVREDNLGGEFLVSTTPLFDEQGTLTASVHVARDITERKRLEKALRQSHDRLEERVRERTGELMQVKETLEAEVGERRSTQEALQQAYQLLDSVFENTHILIAYLDREFIFRRVNRAYAQADGKEPGYYVGKNHFTLFPNEENERVFKDVAESGDPYFIQAKPFLYAEHPERGVTYWDWSLIPIKDPEGRVVNLVLTLLNVTELKKSEEFVHAILDSVDEGFAVIGRDYEVLTANQAFLSLAGKSMPEEVVGRPCYQVLHQWDHPCAQVGEDCAVKRARESGAPCTSLHIHSGLDGRHAMCAETKAFPLRDPDGGISKMIYVVNDISARMKIEDQLRHAQKMEAIGTLAGGIAHDFNNIINVIHGFANLMGEELGSNHPLQSHVREILAAANRATHLTRGLLSMSRKQVADFKRVNINEVIESMHKTILRLLGKEIRVDTVLSPGPLMVMADSGQISQVLMNLATNARDVMPAGGVLRLETSPAKMDDDFIRLNGFGHNGSYAAITVSDTGSGMEEETRRRVFEPYFTTKEDGKGTGLGLSIVHGIIDQHQGFIHCASTPGQGTTFTAYLPLFTAGG